MGNVHATHTVSRCTNIGDNKITNGGIKDYPEGNGEKHIKNQEKIKSKK